MDVLPSRLQFPRVKFTSWTRYFVPLKSRFKTSTLIFKSTWPTLVMWQFRKVATIIPAIKTCVRFQPWATCARRFALFRPKSTPWVRTCPRSSRKLKNALRKWSRRHMAKPWTLSSKSSRVVIPKKCNHERMFVQVTKWYRLTTQWIQCNSISVRPHK